MTTSEYTELWQMQDAITTVANANGYTVWDLRMMDGCFHLELNTHLDEEKASVSGALRMREKNTACKSSWREKLHESKLIPVAISKQV